MINEWIKKGEKTALIFKETAISYSQLIAKAEALEVDLSKANGILYCVDEDLLTQLLSVVRALIEEVPIYFHNTNDEVVFEYQSISKDVFLIATTSGTTGRKKHLYKNKNQWLSSFNAYSETFGIKDSDSLFINGSLAYTANLYSVLHMLNLGGTIILNDEKNPKKWIKDIENHKASIAYLVPSKLKLLCKALPQKWAYNLSITTAGEALSSTILKQLWNRCPNVKVHHYYGAAELGHISAIRHEELLSRPTSVGKAFKGVDLRIQSGVIWGSSTYSISQGKEYDTAFDFGEIDEEGYLYVTGRRDTQINVHGRKFDAMAVINALKNIDGVDEILFVSSTSKQGSNNKGYNIYVIAEGAGKVTSLQCMIDEYLMELIPQWQWPKEIKVVPNGIYSETGKYDMVSIGALFSQ